MNHQSIPEEVISLLQHVELNQNNWWDKSIQRLIIGIVWHSKNRLDTQALTHEVKSMLGVKLSLSKIEENVKKLCDNKDLIMLHDRTLKIPEIRLEGFSNELKKAEDLQNSAKMSFIQNLSSRIPNLPENRGEEIWIAFNEDLLIPMIQKLGARTYSLFSGAHINSDDTPGFKDFLDKQPTVLQDAIRNSILIFMDSNNPVTKSFIIRHLNARFFVEASQLKGKTLQKINEMIEGKPVFNIFLDTNFLFSLLELHDNPSSDAAVSLIKLIKTIGDFAEVNLYVYPLTIDEAKVVIKRTLQTCQKINFQSNLTEAILETEAELTGMIRKYTEERKLRGVTPEQYFQPYLHQLIELIDEKGVRVYDQNVDILRNNQVIKGEIEYQLELQKNHSIRKQKTYFTLEHDVVLWHFIKNLRPARVENPIKAGYWAATIDFGLLGYDSHKRKHNPESLPICLHPTALIHMLQFWVPRNELFDKAILDSLRLPFLFQAFDEKDESITSNILTLISSLENSDKLSVKLIASLLINRALRNKIAETPDVHERIKVIKDAIETEEAELRKKIEEMNAIKKHDDEKQKELLGVIAQKDADLLEAEISENALKQKILKMENEKRIENNIRRFTIKWFIFPFALNVLISILMHQFGIFFFESTWKLAYSLIFFTFALFVHVLIIDNAGQKEDDISTWKYFEKFHTYKKWIVGLLSALAGGLLVNGIYDVLKARYLEYISTLPK